MQMAARIPAPSHSWRPGIDSGGPSSGPMAYISPLIAWAVSGVAFQFRNGPVAPNAVSRQVTAVGGVQLNPGGASTKPATGVAVDGEAITTSAVAASSAEHRQGPLVTDVQRHAAAAGRVPRVEPLGPGVAAAV